MTPTQLETVRAARLQLIDLGDEATAKLLDWAVTEEPDEAPRIGDVGKSGHYFEFKRGEWAVLPDGSVRRWQASGLAYTGGLNREQRDGLDAVIKAYLNALEP